MVAEATSQNREPGFGLPAGIHRRQAWRPAGLRGVESILSGIASRNKAFDSHRSRLTAWYEQFIQRSQPFIGWQPFTTAELWADNTPSSIGSTQSEERISGRESPMISKELPAVRRSVSEAQEEASGTYLHRLPAEQQRPQKPSVLRRSISGPIHTAAKAMSPDERLAADLSGPHERPMEAAVQPVASVARGETANNPALPARSPEDSQLPAKDTRPATEDRGVSQLPSPRPRSEEQSLMRPAVRLAILRPINTAAGTVQRKESGPLASSTSRFSMAETKDFRAPEHWPIEERPAFQPRLASSVSSFPRQEMRGGFPGNPMTEVPRDADTSASDFVRASVSDPSVFENHRSPETPSSARSRQLEIPEPPAVIPPVALPGLQIRLVKPDASAPATQRSANDAAEGGRSKIEIPKTQPPVPAPPPPLDINAVADKVYQALQRRFQFERERRGLY